MGFTYQGHGVDGANDGGGQPYGHKSTTTVDGNGGLVLHTVPLKQTIFQY